MSRLVLFFLALFIASPSVAGISLTEYPCSVDSIQLRALSNDQYVLHGTLGTPTPGYDVKLDKQSFDEDNGVVNLSFTIVPPPKGSILPTVLSSIDLLEEFTAPTAAKKVMASFKRDTGWGINHVECVMESAE